MEKKIYTTPALSVEEFEMTEVICTSPVNNIQGGDLNFGGSDAGYDGPIRANNRGGGIWDED